MKLFFTEHFRHDYLRLPHVIQEQTDEKLDLFLKNERHPSLRVKKMKGAGEIWELRVNHSYRITFKKDKDRRLLRRVGTHDILRKP